MEPIYHVKLEEPETEFLWASERLQLKHLLGNQLCYFWAALPCLGEMLELLRKFGLFGKKHQADERTLVPCLILCCCWLHLICFQHSSLSQTSTGSNPPQLMNTTLLECNKICLPNIREIFDLTARGPGAEQELSDPCLLSDSKYPNILHTISEHNIFLCMNMKSPLLKPTHSGLQLLKLIKGQWQWKNKWKISFLRLSLSLGCLNTQDLHKQLLLQRQ